MNDTPCIRPESDASAGAATRARVLDAARALFVRRGIDAVTIADLARADGGGAVGGRYQAAMARLQHVSGAVPRLAASAAVARAIYEGESAELGLIRSVGTLFTCPARARTGFR